MNSKRKNSGEHNGIELNLPQSSNEPKSERRKVFVKKSRKKKGQESNGDPFQTTKELSNFEKVENHDTITSKKAFKTEQPETRPLKVRKTNKKKDSEIQKKLRNLNWRDLDFIGLEIGAKKDILSGDWEFPELDYELQEGELSTIDFPLYVFMGGQPVDVRSEKGEIKDVLNIPYVIVLVCKRYFHAPPNRIAMASIQLGDEIIMPASHFKISWVPYIPKKIDTCGLDLHTPIPIYTLCDIVRSNHWKTASEEEKHKRSLLLPYDLFPQVFRRKDLAARLAEVINVKCDYLASNGKRIVIAWDKSCMSKALDLEVILEENNLPAEEGEKIWACLKTAFNNAREAVKKRYEEEEKELNAMDKDDYQSLENIHIYKFYPTTKNPAVDVEKYMNNMVNRFFPHASKVFPEKTVNNQNGNVIASVGFQPKLEFSTINPPSLVGFVPSISIGNLSNLGVASDNSLLPVKHSETNSSITGFQFVPPSSSQVGFQFHASSSASTDWACVSCEAMNPATTSTCESCLVPRVPKPTNFPPK